MAHHVRVSRRLPTVPTEERPVHVLYLIDSLMPGGAERSLAALAPHLVAGGIRLEVGTLHERPGVQAELLDAGVRLHSLAGPGGRGAWIRRADRLIRDRRPDLVHTTLFEADLAGRVAAARRRTPVVSSLVNVAYGPEQQAGSRVGSLKLGAARLLDVVSARPVVRFHAVSEHVADVMARRLRLPRARIDVVPRGRDPGLLGRRTPERRAQARAGLGVGPEDRVVLAACRHEPQKGLDVLVQAVPHVLGRDPSTRFLVAGRDGRQTPELRALASRLGVEHAVRFLGARSDVYDLLCAADVFVFPSRWEGMPGAVLEAMALEAPIVASDLQPVREAVSDGVSARLVPSDRPDALALAVIQTLEDDAAAARRAAVARADFEARFTIGRSAEGMLTFYEHARASARSSRWARGNRSAPVAADPHQGTSLNRNRS
jgi:glycosyltransferase involved in cell wall biosynthesis